MNELLGIARFTFHDGKLDEFKRLSRQCMDIVRAQDTGTLQHDIYFDEGETEAIVIEPYADSEALTEHLEHIGNDLLEAILTTGTVEGQTLGSPSPEVRSQLEQSEVRRFTPFLSMRG